MKEWSLIMRTRTLRLAIWAYTAFMLYLYVANSLALAGVADLPLSFGSTVPIRELTIRLTLLVLIVLGVLAMGVVKKRQRLDAQVH